MDNIRTRFREIRTALKMTQEEWSKVLGITRSGVADIEAGRRKVTDKHIKLVCLSPINGKYVNEDFIRTGEGEMFKKLSRQQEIARVAADLFKSEDTSFKSRLIMALASMNEAEWEMLESIARKIAEKKD